MYTYVRIIRHTHNYLKYMRGQTPHKKHPELISDVEIPNRDRIQYTDNRYIQMCLDCKFGNPSLVGSSIQFTLSPMKEDSVDFSGEDWQNLWRTFTEEMDKIDIVPIKKGRGKNAKIEEIRVPKTRLVGSNQLVCLHKDSMSKIPHLHGAVCPVDTDCHRYGLDYLKEKARMAGEIVERKLKLTNVSSDNGNTLSGAYHTCMNVIQDMPEGWSFAEFKKGVRECGYQVLEKRDSEGNVQNWAVKRGDKIFLDTDMCSDFSFKNLYPLWYSLNESYDNPIDKGNLEEILEQIKDRGWYERFLRGEVETDMEARLSDILLRKIAREKEEIDLDELFWRQIQFNESQNHTHDDSDYEGVNDQNEQIGQINQIGEMDDKEEIEEDLVQKVVTSPQTQVNTIFQNNYQFPSIYPQNAGTNEDGDSQGITDEVKEDDPSNVVPHPLTPKRERPISPIRFINVYNFKKEQVRPSAVQPSIVEQQCPSDTVNTGYEHETKPHHQTEPQNVGPREDQATPTENQSSKMEPHDHPSDTVTTYPQPVTDPNYRVIPLNVDHPKEEPIYRGFRR